MARRILPIIIAVLLLASCSVTRDRVTMIAFASYTDYPGMWISPNPCTMQHEVLGHLLIDVTPAIIQQRNGDGIYRSSGISFERIGYDELLEMAVVEARARGANGISNLTITNNRARGETFASLYTVSGLLIKIE